MKSYLRGYICLNMFVLLSASLFLVSCNKDERSITGPSSSTNSTYFTMKVNGVAMSFDTTAGCYDDYGNFTIITTAPYAWTHPEIDLTIPGMTTGTFTQANGGTVAYIDTSNYSYGNAQTCTITITQYGDEGGYIVGTFSATDTCGGKTAKITEGRFSVIRLNYIP
ncbi:MAG: hypothetical protein ABSC53_05515 [Bacteroidota bacterium]